jgi:mRNA interferase MazF
VVLSVAYLDLERAVITYVPRTTALRGTRFEVRHEARGFAPGAFDAQGIEGVPTAKLMRHLGTLDDATLRRVEAAVRAWLNLG